MISATMLVPRTLCMSGVALSLTVLGPAFAQSDAEDLTIRAMCDVGLTASAVNYVTARRALVAEDPSMASKWTMRLMECHAFAALHSQAEAGRHWDQCVAIRDGFMLQEPQSPRIPWIQWQLCRCDLLRAQSELAAYLAAPARTTARDNALEIVRRILSQVEELEADLKQRQPLAAREGLSGGKQAPAAQLAKLSVDAGLMRCEALLIRMRLYATGSADRIASATDVNQQALEILQRTEADWLSRSQLLVAQATANLELGQSSAALQQLEQLASQANNAQAKMRAASVVIEYLASRRESKPSLSRGYAMLPILQQWGSGPEHELAQIQLAVASLDSLTAAVKEQALEQVIARSKRIGARFGDYWRSRAEAILVNSSGGATSTNTDVAADLLIAEVRQLIASGDEAQAIERLLKFRDDEAAAERGISALKVASQAAALWQRQQSWLSAADCLVPVTHKFADLPEAAEVHKQAILYVTEALRSGDAAAVERYEELLKQQLLRWPDSPASAQPSQWLLSWMSKGQRHAEWADVCLHRAAAAREPEVVRHALLMWLGATLLIEEPDSLKQTMEALHALIQDKQLAHGQPMAALVQLSVQSATSWPSEAERIEQQKLLSQLEPQLQSEDAAQLVGALRVLDTVRTSGQHRHLDSLPLQNWEPEVLPPQIREGLARELIEAIDESPWEIHAEWAKRLKLTGSWQEMLSGCSSPRSRAAALRIAAWTGDVSQALDALQELAEKAARNGGWLQLELANALADSGPNRLEDSNRVAKLLVANTQAGSELHWAARWRWCKNLQLAGKTQEAQQAARLVLASQLPTSQLNQANVWQLRFERLAK